MNAEDVDNDVNDMWRLMYKLNKTFGDVVGPRTLADKIRRKIEQFKVHLPLLHVICNPGENKLPHTIVQAVLTSFIGGMGGGGPHRAKFVKAC